LRFLLKYVPKELRIKVLKQLRF